MKIQIKKSNISVTLLSSISLVILSACGGSSGSDTTTPTTTPTPAPVPAPVPTPVPSSFPTQVTAPSVNVVNDSGSLLLAESGLSLYTFDNDALNISNCDGNVDDTDTCAGKWPPLLAADGAVATAKMTIITRSDDSNQWAYKGQPLYHWHQDAAQGDIGGDGINSVWHLARPAALKTTSINSIDSYVGNQTIASVTDSSGVMTAIRANKDGFTLYTFDNDPLDDSACAGNCINVWPPLLADAGAMAMPPLSIINASNGNMQWAYKGKPLYFFASDNAPGDVNGDNIGDVWHVASKTPAIQRNTENGRYLSATGKVNTLMPVGDSTTEFTVSDTDKDGFNLYVFDNDGNEVSNCEGQCLVNWPAFVPSDEDVAIANYTIFDRADGTKQWAYKGKPLYFFINDTTRGDVNGAELNNVWHLIEPGITTNFSQETNDLGSVVTVTGDVHVMERDAGTAEFVDTIADKSGFAIYTFDNDRPGVSNCFDACLDAWPPLLVDDSDVAVEPFSIITRSDNGMKQWALNDMPLYFFTPDTTADAINGENANSVWHIARPAPLKVDNHATQGHLFAAHGNVLDSQGKTSAQLTGLTLYTFDSDIKDSGESECFDTCAVTWPPLYATAQDEAYGDYTIISRSEDNTTTFQWAYQGLPLYFFVGDAQIGDTNGSYPTWTIARP